eukprot:gene28807-31996_t
MLFALKSLDGYRTHTPVHTAGPAATRDTSWDLPDARTCRYRKESTMHNSDVMRLRRCSYAFSLLVLAAATSVLGAASSVSDEALGRPDKYLHTQPGFTQGRARAYPQGPRTLTSEDDFRWQATLTPALTNTSAIFLNIIPPMHLYPIGSVHRCPSSLPSIASSLPLIV